jgi:hypothetical protein
MQLLELILLIQNELQKTYDFTSEMARSNLPDTTGLLHLNIQEVEIEVPILVEEQDVRIPQATLEQVLPNFRFMKVPHNLDKQIVNKPVDVSAVESPPVKERPKPLPVEDLAGKKLDVILVNQKTALAKNITPEMIARIKIVFNPLIK